MEQIEKVNQIKLGNELRVYTINNIGLMTFLFGPLAGAYMLYKNYYLFNDKKATRTTVIVFTFIFILVGMYFLLPFSFPTNFEKILPIFYTVIMYQSADKLQGKDIKNYIDKGGLKYSWWRVLLVSVIAFSITFLYLFLILWYA